MRLERGILFIYLFTVAEICFLGARCTEVELRLTTMGTYSTVRL